MIVKTKDGKVIVWNINKNKNRIREEKISEAHELTLSYVEGGIILLDLTRLGSIRDEMAFHINDLVAVKKLLRYQRFKRETFLILSY
jgi:hypothetical protein